jgi:O-antigen ligase/cytochrome c-type biogenesis protein CcmH/NrfG
VITPEWIAVDGRGDLPGYALSVSRSKASRRVNRIKATDAVNGFVNSKLRLFGVAVLCAKIFLVPVIFDPALDMPFVVSKAVVSHALAYVLAATVAGLFVCFGRSLMVWSPLHIPVIAFVVISAVAALFAMNSTIALYGTHARMLGLNSVLDFAVLYFAIVLLVRTRFDARAIVVAAIGASTVVVTYQAVQMLGADPFDWSISSVERPFSTLGQSTALAQYLTVSAVGGLALGVSAHGLRPSTRVFLLLYALLLLLGSVATGTRSAVIGLGTGGLVLLVMAWRGHSSRRARVVTSLAAAAAIVALSGVLVATPLGARIISTLESPQVEGDEEVLARLEPSTAGRLELYSIAINELKERPVLGYGPDNFTVGVPRYRPENATTPIRQSLATSAHSWIGHVATSSGLVGLAAFVAIGAVAVGLALRAGFRAPAVVGAATLSAFLGTGLTTASEFGTEWLFWLSIGAIGLASGPTQADRPRASRSSRRDRLIAYALLATSIFACISAITAYDASRSARASQQARLAGRSVEALEFGLIATRSDAMRAEYWDTLGLAYAARSGWRDATVAFQRATALAPHDIRYLSDLAAAESQLALGGDASARTRLRALGDRVGQVDPNNPRAHLTRAVVRQFLEDYAGAAVAIERALVLDPSTNPQLYVSAIQIMRGAGRTSEATQIARDGLIVFGPTQNSVAIRVELARTLVAAGNPAEALSELDVALVIEPNDPNARRLRAEILAMPR